MSKFVLSGPRSSYLCLLSWTMPSCVVDGRIKSVNESMVGKMKEDLGGRCSWLFFYIAVERLVKISYSRCSVKVAIHIDHFSVIYVY